MLDEKDGKNMVVINEAAVKTFGWTQPVGKKIDKLGRHYIVEHSLLYMYSDCRVRYILIGDSILSATS